jgi:hypothetical protein
LNFATNFNINESDNWKAYIIFPPRSPSSNPNHNASPAPTGRNQQRIGHGRTGGIHETGGIWTLCADGTPAACAKTGLKNEYGRMEWKQKSKKLLRILVDDGNI